MSPTTSIQIALELCVALFTILCAAITFIARRDEPQRSRYILILLTLGLGLLLGDATAWACLGLPGIAAAFVLHITNAIVYCAYPLMFIFVTRYLYQLLDFHGHRIDTKWLTYMDWICTAHLGLILVSQFTGILYFFDAQNIYHRGPGYASIAIFGVVELIYLMAIILRHIHDLSRFEAIALLSFVILPFCTNIIQLFYYGLSLTEITSSMCMILFFMFHESEKSARILDQKIQLEEQKVAIARKELELSRATIQLTLSQMRPHFIFNALGSIEQLCRTNPPRAAEATHQFAFYLRSNLVAMNSTELKPFPEELAHIHAYVWLEQMRFGEDLCYEEDIQTNVFSIPSLSVQPLVENAIKHGMMGLEDGVLHVKLSTWEDPDSYHIRVTDDGAGFDPADLPTDNRLHVGLSNVRTHIQQMCGGQLLIESSQGHGATFTIVLPKEGTSL